MKTSPSDPTDSPSWYSSVFASWIASSRRARQHREVRTTSGGHGEVQRVRVYLHVHVVVGRDHVALVGHAPLELDKDLLASEVGEERFRVDGLAQWRERATTSEAISASDVER